VTQNGRDEFGPRICITAKCGGSDANERDFLAELGSGNWLPEANLGRLALIVERTRKSALLCVLIHAPSRSSTR
jgi:hypothetical protein